jgi:CBS domain-containing membrane protein
VEHRASYTPGRLGRFFGIAASKPLRSEQWVAAVGTLLGVSLALLATRALLGPDAAVIMVPSLGATAILIFAVPHSLFAQPWPVIGGHLLSALVGVTCHRFLADPALAAAVAVALALAVMQAARCLHPPGGGTALAAVLGGGDIEQLGYAYAVYPVGINCLLLVGAGIAFNYAFAWRRYPASLMRYVHAEPSPARHLVPSEEAVREAMQQLKVVVDVSPAELREVIEQSLALAGDTRRVPSFAVGRCYGSRRSGRHWSVRQIVSEGSDPDTLVYRVVEGSGKHRTGSCTRTEFAHWAGRELRPQWPLGK